MSFSNGYILIIGNLEYLILEPLPIVKEEEIKEYNILNIKEKGIVSYLSFNIYIY